MKKKKVLKKVKKFKKLKLINIKSYDKVVQDVDKTIMKYKLRSVEILAILTHLQAVYLSSLTAKVIDQRNRDMLSEAFAKGGKR